MQLETARFLLRNLAIDDADALNLIPSDREHMRFYPNPFSLEETEEWIARQIAHMDRHGFALLAVEDRATGEFLGNVGPTIQLVDGVDEVELGWSITPRRAREGIATEAALACREWCFRELEAPHLIALVRPDNDPSRGVAENVGMSVWKETVHGSMDLPHLVYRLRRDEVS